MTDMANEIKSAFSGVEGEKALKAIAILARSDEDLFVASEDDRQLAYLEGRRSLYLDIARIVEMEAEENGKSEEA